MSSADNLFPEAVKDFVFDLHDASRRSFIPSELQSLYATSFREITAKYFPNTAWPAPAAIASECGGDPLFVALYDELTLRHLQSVKRPTVKDRVASWHAYTRLFDLLLAEAPPAPAADAAATPARETLHLVPDWCFDLLHEFLYQFQGFCQVRTATYAAAAKAAGGGAPQAGNAEAIEALGQDRDAWTAGTVSMYLRRLAAAGARAEAAGGGPTYRYLGYFAAVTLSRLECLLGDYRASISALDPLYADGAAPLAVGEDMRSPEELVHGVFPARLSLTYHAAVSYLMLRRYKDAASILGGICLFMHRGFKTGQLRKIPGSEQFNKLFDRMVALLAILSHLCPLAVVDDVIAGVVSDKHGAVLSKIEAGEEGYEDLFVFACPKFVNPAVPDYSQALAPGGPALPYGQDAYRLQVGHFAHEMAAHARLRRLRSYMALYTSIDVAQLASFNDLSAEEFAPWLVCFKHKMRQLERGGADSRQDKIGTAMDIHYYVEGNVVHVDEAEKTRRFETYFMKQIKNNDDILRQLENIKIEN